jgi:hypothetical protein
LLNLCKCSLFFLKHRSQKQKLSHVMQSNLNSPPFIGFWQPSQANQVSYAPEASSCSIFLSTYFLIDLDTSLSYCSCLGSIFASPSSSDAIYSYSDSDALPDTSTSSGISSSAMSFMSISLAVAIFSPSSSSAS